MRKTLVALTAAAALVLAGCSGDAADGDDAASDQVAAGSPKVAAKHGDVIDSIAGYEIAPTLATFELAEGRLVVVDPAQPFPEPVVDHMSVLIQHEAPDFFDFKDVDPDNDVIGKAARETARLARETGRYPAFVYNLGSYDPSGNLTGDLWMIEAAGPVSEAVIGEVRAGEYVKLTYPSYEEAMQVLLDRIADAPNPDAYEVIEPAGNTSA